MSFVFWGVRVKGMKNIFNCLMYQVLKKNSLQCKKKKAKNIWVSYTYFDIRYHFFTPTWTGRNCTLFKSLHEDQWSIWSIFYIFLIKYFYNISLSLPVFTNNAKSLIWNDQNGWSIDSNRFSLQDSKKIFPVLGLIIFFTVLL